MQKSDEPDLFAKLKLDDREITFAYASNYMEAGGGSWMNLHASSSAIIECSEGQGVYLAAGDWGRHNAKVSHCDFIGMLIRKM